MFKHTLVSVAAATVALTGCGSDSTSTPTTSAGSAAVTTAAAASCDRVALGSKDGQTLYASVDSPANVVCSEAQHVVREWARQQVGLGTARLPKGWACNSDSVCRRGQASVGMTLIYP